MKRPRRPTKARETAKRAPRNSRVPPLSDLRHDNLLNSAVGEYLDGLVRKDCGSSISAFRGSVIQAIWTAFFTKPKKRK